MKTYEIYKTYGLYTTEEFNDMVVALMEGDDEIEDEKEAEDRAIDLISDYFYDELENIKYTNKGLFNNQTYAILGSIGRWNGTFTIQPHYCKSLTDAIRKCVNDMDEFKIYEDQYGNLKIEAYHHDGTNQFVIKRVAPGNRDAKYLMRCVHLRKEVYGC